MKSDRNQETDLGLDRPPLLERWMGLLGVKAAARLRDREQVLATFRDEAALVMQLAAQVPEPLGRQRVRIARGPGMEQASRTWSVYMAVEHLVIVNRGITAVIHALCAEHNPGVEIRIEDIQPHPEVGPEQIEALAFAVERYLEVVERFGLLRARERYRHPWFGLLTAAEWNVLAAWHNRVHRHQIERLLRVHGIDRR